MRVGFLGDWFEFVKEVHLIYTEHLWSKIRDYRRRNKPPGRWGSPSTVMCAVLPGPPAISPLRHCLATPCARVLSPNCSFILLYVPPTVHAAFNLVSKTSKGASTTMSGTPPDPVDMSAKLDRILGQLTTINKRMDSHDKRIVRTEKF